MSLDEYRNARRGQLQADLLAVVPETIAYYSDGSAALAADFYMDEREAQAAAGRFAAEPVVLDRTVKIRRAVAWAAEADTEQRLALVVQSEVVRPFRSTILTNRRADPESVGYRRIARGESCQFCYMLAARGAVYKDDSAYFAAHNKCKCTAQPVFRGGDLGPEADVLQYIAAGRKRTAAQKARVQAYLDANYPRAEREFWAPLPSY